MHDTAETKAVRVPWKKAKVEPQVEPAFRLRRNVQWCGLLSQLNPEQNRSEPQTSHRFSPPRNIEVTSSVVINLSWP